MAKPLSEKRLANLREFPRYLDIEGYHDLAKDCRDLLAARDELAAEVAELAAEVARLTPDADLGAAGLMEEASNAE